MPNIIIKNCWNGSVIYDGEISDLSGSNLRGSDLRGSDLSGSNLRGSDLSSSDLSGSDLRDSDLSGSDLSGSNLRGSDLRYCNLRGSDLSYCNLRGGDLSGSDLRDSNLIGSDLSYCDLIDCKNTPLVINGLRWIVQISGTGWMQIGCQKHSVIEWDDFDDDRISSMGSDALTFWKSHKQMLMGLCAIWVHADESK